MYTYYKMTNNTIIADIQLYQKLKNYKINTLFL